MDLQWSVMAETLSAQCCEHKSGTIFGGLVQPLQKTGELFSTQHMPAPSVTEF
jgi:hypothetical protein